MMTFPCLNFWRSTATYRLVGVMTLERTLRFIRVQRKVCLHGCVRGCVRVCVRGCVRGCVRVYMCARPRPIVPLESHDPSLAFQAIDR